MTRLHEGVALVLGNYYSILAAIRGDFGSCSDRRLRDWISKPQPTTFGLPALLVESERVVSLSHQLSFVRIHMLSSN